MTQASGSPTRQEVAAFRLIGRRFDQAGIPAAALVEVVAFEDLVREIAKQRWRDRNPGRKRVPNGYDDRIGLRLVDIRDGSAVAVLDRPPSIDDGLFGEDEVLSDLAHARLEIENFIAAAQVGGELPASIRAIPRSKVTKFGQTLRSDEALQVGVPSRSELVWSDRRRFTRDDRKRMLISLTGGYTDLTSIDGVIETLNISQRTSAVRTAPGDLITASWADTGVRFEVADSEEVSLPCHIEGIGQYDRDGTLIKFVEVDSFVLLDVDEPQEEIFGGVAPLRKVSSSRARTLVLPIRSLGEGWIDGDTGSPIADELVNRAEQFADLLEDNGFVVERLYPTLDGGVQFEWTLHDMRASVEIEAGGQTIYAHIADLDHGTYSEERFAVDLADGGTRIVIWLRTGLVSSD